MTQFKGENKDDYDQLFYDEFFSKLISATSAQMLDAINNTLGDVIAKGIEAGTKPEELQHRINATLNALTQTQDQVILLAVRTYLNRNNVKNFALQQQEQLDRALQQQAEAEQKAKAAGQTVSGGH